MTPSDPPAKDVRLDVTDPDAPPHIQSDAIDLDDGSATIALDGRDPFLPSDALLPRRARPPWVRPDVLVLGDELPSFLKREKGFHALTRAGLDQLLELASPARARGRSGRPPIVAVQSLADLDSRTVADLRSLRRRGVPVVSLSVMLERRLRLYVLKSGGAHDELAGPPSPSLAYLGLKRAVDLVLGLLGLVGFLVLLPFVALAIYLEDGRPIFYAQDRVGRDGRIFRLLKFRSMSTDAECLGPAWSRSDDERITRVGQILRGTKLDELPQFVNIILGHMSLVGPRPERPYFVDILKRHVPHYDLRHRIRPGLTGWGTIRVGYANSIEAKLLQHQFDLWHIKNHSLIFDMEILARSFMMLALRSGQIDRYML